GSDRAVIAGLLDMETDDVRIRESLDLAKESGFEWQFKAVMNASALHPNAIRIRVKAGKKEIEVLGISRGGGLVSIVEMDGFRCNFTAQQHTLIVTAQDVKGSIAFIASILSHEDCNIATMTVDRHAKDGVARLVLEVDSPVRDLTVDYIESQRWVDLVTFLPDIHL
ncbi:MAG: L-serine ammonia-lyase, iron-sulfur-dependent, subunit beta, partial [Bacteroidota bacterium]